MFLSPVDTEKYPDATQKYRFERVQPGNSAAETQKAEEKVGNEESKELPEEPTGSEEDTEEEKVRPEILRFLDAEGAEAKLEVLRELRMDLDESLLTTIELSLDMLPDDKESLERRFDFVERTLEQRIRFEGGRLR